MSDSVRNQEAIDRQANTCHEEVLNLYADLALDAGKEELAESYRWMAQEGKWPLRSKSGKYSWGREGARFTPWGLPPRVIAMARCSGEFLRGSSTPAKAIRLAARFLTYCLQEHGKIK